MKYFVIFIILMSFVACSKNNVKKDENKKDGIKKEAVRKKSEVNDKNLPMMKLPAETQIVINFKSLKSVFDNFLIKNDLIFGVKLDEVDLKDFKEALSFNPLELKSWENIGIDISKEFGIAFSDLLLGGGDFDSITVTTYLPLKDAKKTEEFLIKKFTDPKVKDVFNLKKENGYIKVFGKKPEEVIYFAIKKDILFVVVNAYNPQNSLNFTKEILKGKLTLKDSTNFKSVSSLMPSDAGVYVYGNTEDLINKNLVKIQKVFNAEKEVGEFALEFLKSYKVALFGLYLDKSDFMMKIFAKISQNVNISDLLASVKYNKTTVLGIDKPALMFFSFGINIQKYIDLFKSKMTDSDKKDYENGIKEAKEKYGIDLEKDLIENLNGGFNLAVYDGMSITATNYNVLITIGFKDIKRFIAMFDKLLANENFKDGAKFINKTELNGKPLYIINAVYLQIYMGYKDNELIFASSKSIFEDAMKAAKGKGFYKVAQNDENLKNMISTNSFWYVSLSETAKALANFKTMIPLESYKITSDILEFFKYALIYKKIDSKLFESYYMIKTSDNRPFFKLIADLVKKYNK